MVATAQHHHTLTRICIFNGLAEEVNGTEVRGEDNHSLALILPPQCAKRMEQFIHLGLSPRRKLRQKTLYPKALFRQGKAHSGCGQLFALRAFVLDGIVVSG